jgi:hypothetical protein
VRSGFLLIFSMPLGYGSGMARCGHRAKPLESGYASQDDRFAKWAAAFLRTVGADGGAGAGQGDAAAPGLRYEGITPAAGDLLRSVDAGGIPAFVTGNLRQIASDNGIDVEPRIDAERDRGRDPNSAPARRA